MAIGAFLVDHPLSGVTSFNPPAAVVSLASDHIPCIEAAVVSPAYTTTFDGGAAAVVNDQTGPVVEPTLLEAITCQKYVVETASDPGRYDPAARPVAACGGGLL